MSTPYTSPVQYIRSNLPAKERLTSLIEMGQLFGLYPRDIAPVIDELGAAPALELHSVQFWGDDAVAKIFAELQRRNMI